MFKFRKHGNDICLSFHIGYDPAYKAVLILVSLYKYTLSIDIGV